MSKLDSLYAAEEAAHDALEKARIAVKAEEGRLVKLTSIEKRKASTLIRCFGKAIVLSRKNTHGERKVHWHDGRKGDLIDDYSCISDYEWRIWLAERVEESSRDLLNSLT